MDYAGALRRPFSDWKKLLIGLVISIIPVVNLISIGYQLECARLTLKKKNELAEWNDYLNLFIDGLLASVIALIYFIPTMILFVVAIGTDKLKLLYDGDALAQVDLLNLLNGNLALVGFVILFITLFVVYGAMMNYAKFSHFKSGFDLKAIFKQIFTVRYLEAWVIFILVGLILGYLFGFIPYVGNDLGRFISGLIGFTLIAESFRQI